MSSPPKAQAPQGQGQPATDATSISDKAGLMVSIGIFKQGVR